MDKQKDFEKGWEDYKTKRKQQTEEMIGIIQKSVGGCARNWASLIAEELIKYYQSKIPEGAVVLTREEYSDYLVMKDAHQNAIERCEKLQADNERLYKNIGKFKDAVRKETAEKFAEMLKSIAKDKLELYGWQMVDIDDIDEICKELEGEK